MTDDIKLTRAGALARVLLDRPKALNALTLPMIETLAPALTAWAADEGVAAVLVEGAGERAFCAGGDVRAVWEKGRAGGPRGDDDLTVVFFREEYRLNRQIHRFPKPYVAFLDGITMGGGVGLSVHGSHRIVTERTMFAMPETGIGLFPDVGGTWFLTRAPGRLGEYLALTGARLKGRDVIDSGIGTHFVPSGRLEDLTRTLSETRWQAGHERGQVTAAIEDAAGDPGPSEIGPHRAVIDRCFGEESVEAILDALARDGSDFARETRDGLLKKSPTSLKVVFAQLRRGAGLAIEDALRMEFRIVQRCMDGHDFFEGIRAVLVEKDHAPKWNPDRLDAVAAADVEGYFAPLGARELTFP